MGRRSGEIALTLLAALCFALLLADGARWFVRLDLTRNKAYSISPVSRDILRGIPEQVHVTYFLSDTLRSLSPSPGRVIDLLREYAAESRGKLVVTVLDPEKTGQGESARRFGILPQQIQVIQQNEQRTVDVYSGIAIDYLDRYTSLPAVFTPDGLEYSLSFAVRKVLAGRRLVVGVILGSRANPSATTSTRCRPGSSRDYSLHEYLPGDPIPPEVDVLMVIGGTQWREQELRPIDTYIMNGGKVLFAVKGLHVKTAGTFTAQPVGASPLLDMIDSYGVRVGREMVLDTASRDYRLPQQRPNGQIGWETIGRYPPWVSIQGPDVSSANPMTARFAGSGPVVAGCTDSRSARRRAGGSACQDDRFGLGAEAPVCRGSLQGRAAGNIPRSVCPCCRALRDVPLVFPLLPIAQGVPTRMIVVGDDDFLTDLMQFSDSLSNVFFVENAILWLSGNGDLLSIKTRAATEGKLDRIQDPVLRSRLMLAAELLNVAVIPLLIVLLGLLRRMRRREKGGA